MMSGKMKLPHPLLMITGVGILLYARTLSFDYTSFDDNVLIRDNQAYISNLSNFFDAFGKTVFITGSDVFYRPVETLWFMMNAQMGGSELFIYHLTSLLLHLLAVWLFFLLLRRSDLPEEPSLFLSLVYLAHPVLTQAVAWIPGVVDILVAVFCLGSFIFFLDFLKSRKRKHYVLHLFLFALALYTKETAVGMMAIGLFYLLFIRKEKIVSYNSKVFLAGWIAVSVVWFMMRDAALKDQPPHDLAGMVASMFSNLPGFLLYIGKVLLPFNLSVMPVLSDNSLVFGIVSLAALTALVFISKDKKGGMVFFSVLWFLVFLFPTFIRTSEFRVHQFYEHRMYLPMAGVLLLVSQSVWIRNFSLENIKYRIAAPLIVLFFFVLTFRHATVFSDTKHFLDNAIATAPGSSLAHRNMGIYYQDLDEQTKHADKTYLEKAADEYKQALSLNPKEKDLHNNLGVIYDTWGKKELAMNEYLAETNLNPSNSQAWHNLGVMYLERNENEKAEKCLLNAIKIRPVPSSYKQLALLYKKTGNQNEYQKIISILKGSQDASGSAANGNVPVTDPAAPSDPVELGRQLLQQGKAREAEQVFLKVLSADSLNKTAWFNLGLICYSTNRKPEAELSWRKAVRIDSTYTDAYNNLAICLAQQGKNPEAEVVLKKIVAANPDYVDGYFNIANFYARNGKDKEALVYLNLLKKKGIAKESFVQRGVKLSPELEKLFDQ